MPRHIPLRSRLRSSMYLTIPKCPTYATSHVPVAAIPLPSITSFSYIHFSFRHLIMAVPNPSPAVQLEKRLSQNLFQIISFVAKAVNRLNDQVSVHLQATVVIPQLTIWHTETICILS